MQFGDPFFFLNSFFFAFAKSTIIIFYFGVQFVHVDVFMLILFQTCIYSDSKGL